MAARLYYPVRTLRDIDHAEASLWYRVYELDGRLYYIETKKTGRKQSVKWNDLEGQLLTKADLYTPLLPSYKRSHVIDDDAPTQQSDKNSACYHSKPHVGVYTPPIRRNYPRLAQNKIATCEVLAANPHPNLLAYRGVVADDSGAYVDSLCFDRYTINLQEALQLGADENGLNLGLYHSIKLTIINQIKAGLDHMHALGYIHGDVNPSNILLSRLDDGKVRAVLADFDSCTVTNTKPGRMKKSGEGYQIKTDLSTAENDWYGIRTVAHLLGLSLPDTSLRKYNEVRSCWVHGAQIFWYRTYEFAGDLYYLEVQKEGAVRPIDWDGYFGLLLEKANLYPAMSDTYTRAHTSSSSGEHADHECYHKMQDASRYCSMNGNNYAQLALQEIEACEALAKHPHPNIVSYHGVVVDAEAKSVIALCFQKHQTDLRKVVASRKGHHPRSDISANISISEQSKVTIMRDIERALQHMHSLGYIHNDVNPNNILVDFSADGEVVKTVLADFDACRPIHTKWQHKRGTDGFCIETDDSTPKNDWYGWEKTAEFLGVHVSRDQD